MASKSEDMTHYQNKLKKLQKSIKKVQQHLKGSKKQRSNILTELKNLEAEISKNARQLQQLSTDIKASKKQKSRHEKDLKQLNRELAQQKQILSEQVRSAYGMGGQQNLKMLLNQQDPAQMGRAQTYFGYLNKARTEQIEQFLHNIKQKQETEESLRQVISKQTVLLDQQSDKKRERVKQRQQRKKLLTEISQKIKNQENTLSNLETSRGRIENLLKSLGELLADIPTSPSEQKPFMAQKGKLPWPVNGPFLGKYGEDKHYGDLKWNGMLIKAKYGTPIKVISHGRVAFSDWLQGFGFITIVDHGQGYMSLYAHSESLFKEAGDWVQAGEVIATAGDSGGQPQSGVYFEIRSRGKPVNPVKWCSTSARHPNLASKAL